MIDPICKCGHSLILHGYYPTACSACECGEYKWAEDRAILEETRNDRPSQQAYYWLREESK